MQYFVRAVKYLLLLCVLYVGLEWLMLEFAPTEATAGCSIMDIMQMRFAESRGKMLVVALVVLAALYPRFGFMTSRIEGCSFECDGVRLDNAMSVYGFKLVEEHDGVRVYRAEGIVRRLTLMFEDKIEVRSVGEAVELKGMRRTVARIAYQLQTYLHNSRFEQNETK